MHPILENYRRVAEVLGCFGYCNTDYEKMLNKVSEILCEAGVNVEWIAEKGKGIYVTSGKLRIKEGVGSEEILCAVAEALSEYYQ